MRFRQNEPYLRAIGVRWKAGTNVPVRRSLLAIPRAKYVPEWYATREPSKSDTCPRRLSVFIFGSAMKSFAAFRPCTCPAGRRNSKERACAGEREWWSRSAWRWCATSVQFSRDACIVRSQRHRPPFSPSRSLAPRAFDSLSHTVHCSGERFRNLTRRRKNGTSPSVHSMLCYHVI